MKRGEVPKKVHGVFEKVPGSKIWWIQYFENGRRRREKAGSKKNAIDLYTKRKAQVLTGVKLPEKLRRRPVTFKEIADAALDYSRREKLSAKQDEYRMARVVDRFGNQLAESITSEGFEAWLSEEAAEREWTPASQNRYIALIKMTYKQAEKNQKIKINPARALRKLKENNERVRYLNQFEPADTDVDYLQGVATEEDRLRAVIQREYPYHLPEFEIALHTGMRRSEQYRILWRDVDLAHQVLRVPQSKSGKPRKVHLNSVALAMFTFLRNRVKDHDRVFVRMHSEEPLTKNRHWFENAVAKAGIQDFTWHDLRHTFASRLTMAGVDIKTVKDLMGHATIQMTCRYSHLSADHQLAAVERLVSVQPSATRSATEQNGSTASWAARTN